MKETIFFVQSFNTIIIAFFSRIESNEGIEKEDIPNFQDVLLYSSGQA